MKKGKTVACFHCRRRITAHGLSDIKTTQFVCKGCWSKDNPANPKYMTEHGEAEIIDFRAITQEENMKLVCFSKKCGKEVHNVGDVVIFIGCKVKYSDGKLFVYETFFAIPPARYWCSYSNGH